MRKEQINHYDPTMDRKSKFNRGHALCGAGKGYMSYCDPDLKWVTCKKCLKKAQDGKPKLLF